MTLLSLVPICRSDNAGWQQLFHWTQI